MERVRALIFDESDDEEIFANHQRRPRWIRERNTDFDDLDHIDFIKKFRLNKDTVYSVSESIEDQLEYPSDKNFCVSPINQLLCALRFYATGGFQSTIADLCGISTSTAHRIVHKTSAAIASLRPRHIFFPRTAAEIRETQMDFYDKARFPNVIGAIDCTHIKYFKSPGADNGELFRNRKGYFSLNVQAIGNANLEFLDIVARWPGSTHDSHIFNNCRQRALFEQRHYDDAVLVGDGGYACTSYMMTPFDHCNTPAENLYNESQIRTRNPIERQFGVWKRRFPVLALGLAVTVQNSFPIIVATAVLHNIARRAGDELPLDDRELLLPAPWEELLAQGNIDYNIENGGRANRNDQRRREIVDTYFANLV